MHSQPLTSYQGVRHHRSYRQRVNRVEVQAHRRLHMGPYQIQLVILGRLSVCNRGGKVVM